MKRPLIGFLIGLAAGTAFSLRAALPSHDEASPVPVSGPTIELPPIIVAETAGSTPWLYVRVRDEEYLSRCSPGATRAFIESRERAMARLSAIVPDVFLSDLPSVTLLSDQSQQPKADDQIAREILRPRPGLLSGPSPGVVRFLPNLRLDDSDFSALFAYVDESAANTMELATTRSYLRFRLERRTPMLPPWLIEGILAVHAQISRHEKPVTLQPFVWRSMEESRALARNPLRPRALLPAAEMFAPDALRAEGDRHPLRVKTLQAQVGLFVRWALDPHNHVRDAFWVFAARASEQRVTEEMFVQCFGFGFSDLRDQLNDYLPSAVQQSLALEPGPSRKISIPESKVANRRDMLRIRGEWERLEIAYVQRSQPTYAARYIEQARHTLRRAYDEGDRDPRLLAAIGLCEVDAGDAAAGIPFLEQAWATGVARPRAAYELARFRFARLLEGRPPEQLFSAAEVAPVLEPLRKTTAYTPRMPETFGLLADVRARCRESAPSGDIDALLLGARSFALNPSVSYRIAFALARSGRRAEAAELLTTSVEYVRDDTKRAQFIQFQSVLARAPRPAP